MLDYPLRSQAKSDQFSPYTHQIPEDSTDVKLEGRAPPEFHEDINVRGSTGIETVKLELRHIV